MSGVNKKLRKYSHGNPGFSLIEILIAMAILGVAIIGIVGLLPGSYFRITQGGRVSVMTHLGQEKVDELRSLSFSDSDLVAGTHPSPFPAFYVIDDDTYSVDWTVVDGRPGTTPTEYTPESNLKSAKITVGFMLYDSSGNLLPATTYQKSVTFDIYITK